MKTFYEPGKQIPVYAEVDVLVVGGGPAGSVAAISAARLGADTLLVERQAYLGGSLTASLMGMISGFRNQKPPNALQAVRGIPQEIVLQLHRMDALALGPHEQQVFELSHAQLSYSYAVDVEKLKVLLMKMADDSRCDALLHTLATAPISESNRVLGVIVENRSGRQAIFAKVVVDCTGDAAVAFGAGAIRHDTPEASASRSAPNLMYKVAGFRPVAGYRFPGVLMGGSLLVPGPAISAGCTGAGELSRSEMHARTEVLEHFERLRAAHPLLENAFVVETPPSMGFARSRYVQCEYTLTENDALSGARFPDTIAVSAAPIPHYYGSVKYLDHEGFDVPYRCMLPVGIDGLLVAGRCISCEPQPYESLNVKACTMAIGQAAGAAAAVAAERGIVPRQVNVIELQQTLLKHGAEVRRSRTVRQEATSGVW
ncbi:MAG: FAD-dependent oxidoreductase [Planctomycetes bacterium]|nr:FAD-dependent oxidoreductase [Planctomycetota bacterium]